MDEGRWSFLTESTACGLSMRRYIYALGVLGVLVLIGTYFYQYHYAAPRGLPGMNPVGMAPSPQARAVQFAGAANGLGMNVVTPGVPPVIGLDAKPPLSHQQDGRAQMPCGTCHQQRGAAGAAVAMMTPVDRQLLPTTPTLPTPVLEDRMSFAHVVQHLKPSVVNINAMRTTNAAAAPQQGDGKPQFANPFNGTTVESVGSGVVVSVDGYIVTNYHVIRDAGGIAVTVFGDLGPKRYSAEVVKLDERQDLALLKVRPDELLKPAPLGNSDQVEIAESVITLGSPFGLDQTVSRGIVSGLRKAMVIENITHDSLLQTDAAINQGNSGGALVNRRGEVIGINTAIYTPTGAFSGIGFAIPVNKVKAFIIDQVPQAGNTVVQQGATAAGAMAVAGNGAAAPPISANAQPPGSHADGRSQMNCATCHRIQGGGQGTPAAFSASPVQGLSVAAPSGPPIAADAPIPGNHRRDGRDQMPCASCHQIIGGGKPVAFAMPAEGIPNPLLPSLLPIAGIASQQTYFEGAILEPLTSLVQGGLNAPVTDGAFVTTVYPDTAAARSGLRAGDIIFKLNGRWVMNPAEITQRMAEYRVGDNLRLGVYTGGQRRNLYLVVTGQNSPAASRQLGAANAAPAPLVADETIWLGMELQPITPVQVARNPGLAGKRGMLIGDVDPGSVAQGAGLQKGDIIKSINGNPISNVAELERMIRSPELKTGMLMLVERNGRELYLTVQS